MLLATLTSKACFAETVVLVIPVPAVSKIRDFCVPSICIVEVDAPVGKGKLVASIVKEPPPSATFKCPEAFTSNV